MIAKISALAGAALLAAASFTAHAAGVPRLWRDFTSVKLIMTQPGAAGDVTYTALFDHETHDMAIDIDTHGPKDGIHGVAGMVAGRILVSKGLPLQQGH